MHHLPVSQYCSARICACGNARVRIKYWNFHIVAKPPMGTSPKFVLTVRYRWLISACKARSFVVSFIVSFEKLELVSSSYNKPRLSARDCNGKGDCSLVFPSHDLMLVLSYTCCAKFIGSQGRPPDLAYKWYTTPSRVLECTAFRLFTLLTSAVTLKGMSATVTKLSSFLDKHSQITGVVSFSNTNERMTGQGTNECF